MRAIIRFSVLTLLSLCAREAAAHFIWAVVEPGSAGQPVARLYFSEGPYADEARLLEKIAGAKVSLRSARGEAQPLELKAESVDGLGSLAAPVDESGPFALEVFCDYGPLTRGDARFLLQYYAKHLRADAAADLNAVARAEALPLDIVPRRTDAGVEVTVLWQGQPAANAEVQFQPAKGSNIDAKTDAEGKAVFPVADPGLYAFRAKFVEEGRAGERDGVKYDSARHYATLTLALTAAASAPATTEAAAESAGGVLERAWAARAEWTDFPGFEAKLRIAVNDSVANGRIIVSNSGGVTLEGFEGIELDAVQRQLESLVGHRLGSGGGGEEVSFADDQTDHPLGRRLRLNDDLDSYYRVRGDVITEVQRKMGSGRFTITVLEVHRNAEDKYLPQLYTVSSWAEDGSLRSTSTAEETWTRVGTFDLPQRVVHVVAGGEREHRVTRLDFSDHKLLTPAATADD
jgi:hypothetical protein